jgi:inorganic pyrophosphatase
VPEPNLMKLDVRDRESGLVNAVVETPAGSRNKYRYDEKIGLFRLHKVLPRGARFPFDFGFIPGTRAADGDPIDLLIIADESSVQGTLLTVRLIGALEAEQTERKETIRNDRLLGVPQGEKIRPSARSMKDLPKKMIEEIEHFFVAYNQAEGRRFVVLRRSGPVVAGKLVDQAVREYRSAEKNSAKG